MESATCFYFSLDDLQPRHGLIKDIWGMLRYHKKWWLTPIIVVLLIVGLVVILGGSVVAPFIYTLF